MTEQPEILDKKQKIIRTVCIVLCVIFGICVVLNMASLIRTWIHPELPPGVLGITPTVVNSDSMAGEAKDSVNKGSLVLIRKVKMEKCEVGDVVAYCEDKQVLIGRITVIKEDEDGGLFFHVKADNLEGMYRDHATEENFLGVVGLRIGALGSFSKFMNTWAGIILFEAIPWGACVAIVGYEVSALIKARRAQQSDGDGEPPAA